MSQLSDAIREHLELKRRHGAREEEISQQEAEALGPVRREPDAVSPLAEEDDRASRSFDAETALIGSEQFHEESTELEEEPEPFALEDSEEEGDPEEPPGYHAPLEEPERGVQESADEPLDDDVASVFPEPDPTVPDERMSAEDPPAIGPRPLVDEAPVVHDEPLAEDGDGDELRLTGPSPDRESVVDPLEEPELLPAELVAFQDPEPVGVPESDPFATQPHALPDIEDEPLEDGRPALLDEDELEAFEEGRGEPPAGGRLADFEEDDTEEPLLLEDTAGSLAYDALEDDPIEDEPMADEPMTDDPNFRPEEDPIEDDADFRPEDDPIEDDADFRPEDDPPRSSVTPPPRDAGGFDFDA